MGRNRTNAAALLLAVAAAGCARHGPGTDLDSAVELQSAFTSVAEKVLPSVVCLTSYVRDDTVAEGRPDAAWQQADASESRYTGVRPLASGTGFVISDDGYILCCEHILRMPDGTLTDVVDAETPDGRISLCSVVGTEPTLNLAVLKIEIYPTVRPPTLDPVAIADPQSVRVGHWAIAVGDPQGPQRTYAAGVIASRPHRDCYQADLSSTFLQASVQIPPEAYGGPLVNIHGEVMGITTPADPDDLEAAVPGHVFALPMSIATGIYEALKVAGTSVSPWLGFSVLNMAEYRRHLKTQGIERDPQQPLTGVYIDDVFDPSPATRADVRVGDTLTRIDGQRLTSVFDFQTRLYLAGVGRSLTLELYRDGATVTRQITVEARPDTAN